MLSTPLNFEGVLEKILWCHMQFCHKVWFEKWKININLDGVVSSSKK